ncbi:MAG: DUF559 domain-containing protein [Ignavibacteriales bacterium]|nr:DUF559 domain-containing protein [Ignavibacteriales bacterium]
MKEGLVQGKYFLPYNPNNIAKARDLRRNMTKTEVKLWREYLQPHPAKFLKQKPIDHYIVDFFCPKAMLIIEIDGGGHYTEDGKNYDAERTATLEGYGLRELRFTNTEVLHSFEAVCKKIEAALEERGGDPAGRG